MFVFMWGKPENELYLGSNEKKNAGKEQGKDWTNAGKEQGKDWTKIYWTEVDN